LLHAPTPDIQHSFALKRLAWQMTGTSDAQLVARIRTGDRDAAEALAQKYLPIGRALALAILGNVADAEDVCQDAFLIALRDIDQCRKPQRFGAWLSQILRNRARDLMRQRRARPDVAVELAGLRAEPEQLERAARAELRERLLHALAQLDAAQREAVLLHDMEGWKHREIADLLGLPSGTVRSHVHHARARLRRLLGHTHLEERQ
jgi:RNA polymerase sigma-70 factor (ECF subfamily)